MPFRLGIDEAGRGCVLGPLVVGAVAAGPADTRWLKKIGARDSKKVPPREREELSAAIRERLWFQLAVAEPPEIDAAVADRALTLNGLEFAHMSALMRAASATHGNAIRVTVDAPGRNLAAIATKLATLSGWDVRRIDARNFADATDVTVSAASLVAKVERDRRLANLADTLDEDLGCGYPHDEKTKQHLSRCAPGAPHVRWSWSTAQRAIKKI